MLDQEQANSDYGVYINSTNAWMQTVTNNNNNLISVEFGIVRKGMPSDLFVELRDDNGVEVFVIPASVLPDEVAHWVSINPSSGTFTNKNIEISLVTNEPYSTTTYWGWMIQSQNPYDKGTLYQFENGVKTEYIEDGAPHDATFRTYTEGPACSTYSDSGACITAGCYWWNNTCHDGPPTECSQLNNQTECESANCYWCDGTCQNTPCTVNCSDYTSQTACQNAGCYWCGSACQSTPCGACSTYTNESACESAGCRWWNNSCHDSKPVYCSELNNSSDCTRWGCYWYNDACHGSPQPTEDVLDTAISCGWVNGCRDYGPLKTHFNMSDMVYVFFHLNGPDFYGKTLHADWYWNGKYICDSAGHTYTEHYTNVCYYTWIDGFGEDFGPGSGYLKLFVDGVHLGNCNVWYVDLPSCDYWDNSSDCEQYGCWWWNNTCQTNQPTACDQITVVSDCNRWGCYWYEGACHGDCPWWWNDGCHSNPPQYCSDLNNQTDCEGFGCYWYNNTCNSEPFVEPDICDWVIEKGGIAGLDVSEVFEIIDSYVQLTPPAGYTFIPTIQQIFGVIDYYLGIDGDLKTGCKFYSACSEMPTEQECLKYGCYWVDGACQTGLPSP